MKIDIVDLVVRLIKKFPAIVRLIKKFPRLIAAFFVIDRECRMALHMLFTHIPSIIVRRHFRKRDLVQPKPLAWRIGLGIGCDHRNLVAFIKERGLEFAEGSHSLYLPPQENLKQCLGDMVALYPKTAGFKILKRIDRAEDCKYVFERAQSSSWFEEKATGSATDYVRTACLLNLLDLGPELFDYMLIVDTIDGGILKCFVVEHMPAIPTSDDYNNFMDRLVPYVERQVINIIAPTGLHHKDFNPPDCSGNLRKTNIDSEAYYIDAQQVAFSSPFEIAQEMVAKASQSLHFGNTIGLFRKRKYLYQDIPGLTCTGKRDTVKRWEKISDMLTASHLEVANRIVIDVCCNSGMMLLHALSDGASWGIGWDRPEIASVAVKIHKGLGNYRLTFRGALLSDDYPILPDIPDHLTNRLDGCIILYLAAWRHVGFLKDIRNIPFSAVIFEGHEADSDNSVETILTKASAAWNCETSRLSAIRDGDCRSRPLAILTPL